MAELHIDFMPALQRAMDRKSGTIDNQTAQTLEQANKELYNRIQADRRGYIMDLEEYKLLNYYQYTYEHNDVAQRAIKRFWDNFKGDATALKASTTSSKWSGSTSIASTASPKRGGSTSIASPASPEQGWSTSIASPASPGRGKSTLIASIVSSEQSSNTSKANTASSGRSGSILIVENAQEQQTWEKCRTCEMQKRICEWNESQSTASCAYCAEKDVECSFEDAYILIMGPMGVHRRLLTDLWFDNYELTTTTSGDRTGRFREMYLKRANGRNVHIIDSPGTDILNRTDTGLREIAYFLAKAYREGRKLAGIIYLFPIDQLEMPYILHTRMSLFQHLVGEGNLSRIVLATTKWGKFDADLFEVEEARLRTHFWVSMLEKGCRMARLHGHTEKVLLLLDALMDSTPRRPGKDARSLQIQKELVDEGIPFSQTTVGLCLESIAKQGLKPQTSQDRMLPEWMSLRRKMGEHAGESYLDSKGYRVSKNVLGSPDLLGWKMGRSRYNSAEEEEAADFITMKLNESIGVKARSSYKGKQDARFDDLIVELQSQKEKLQRLQEQASAQQSHPSMPLLNAPDVVGVAGAPSPLLQPGGERTKARRSRKTASQPSKTPDSSLDPQGFSSSLQSPEFMDDGKSPDVKSRATNLKSPKSTKSAFQADLDDVDSGFEGTQNLRSNVARNEFRKIKSAFSEERSESGLQGQLNMVNHHRRVAHEERMRLRSELYENSWLALLSRFGPLNSPALEDQNLRLHIELYDKVRSATGPDADPTNYFPGDLPKPVTDPATVNPQEQETVDPFRSTVSWLKNEARPYLMLLSNISVLLWSNWTSVSENSPAKDSLSAIVLSGTSEGVVELRRIEIELIRSLIDSLKDAVTIVTDFHISQSQLTAIADQILTHSRTILQNLHPSKHLDSRIPTYVGSAGLEEPKELNLDELYLISALRFCETALERLDLALLSYEGAHMTDLPDSFRMFDSRVIKVFNGQKWASEVAFSGCVMRLPLKCLAPFLGYQDVWVFCDNLRPSASNYYLSTDIETFADVWGPVWKVLHPKDRNRILRYNVGAGSIVPWPEDKMQHPPLTEHQRLCHWTRDIDRPRNSGNSSVSSSESSSSGTEEEDSEIEVPQQEKPFHGSEKLLIGAKTSPRLQWKSCRCSSEVLKRYLKEAGRLSHLLSSKSYRYVEAQESTMVIGSHGVQVGMNKSYKFMKEEPLKIGLLSMWENEPEFRDPREFENFWGVAISICTMNAQRVRLTEILGEKSVLSLLKHFRWSDQDANGESQKRQKFFEAVRSPNPRSLGDLWDENPTWREDVGSALLICLRVLAKTGFDGNRLELSALWLPSGCHGPRRVTLKPEDQTWTKILKDNTCSMTVAVIVDDKLGDEPPCKHGNSQWFRKPSILETAISINRALDPTPDLLRASHCLDEYPSMIRLDRASWRNVWEVSNLDSGKCFWIGPEDRLKVLRPLSKWHLLLEVDTVKRAIIRDWIGMKPSERISHWEYTDEGAESVDVRPIPVHITS